MDLGLNMKIDAYPFAVLLVASLVIGFFAGTYFQMVSDFKYKDATIMTCDYANNLTDIINLQVKTLNLYTNTNYTNLNRLNCSLIK